jgi:small subunit ribosomal protein S13
VPRLAGVDIPNDKIVKVALRYIHGVGETTADEVVEKAGIEPTKRARDLTDDELSRLANVLDKGYVIEGQLRRQVAQNVQRLKKIGCYRGLRHIRGLPVRGQRTRTNARTRKGRKKTVAGKKSVKGMR